VECARKAGVVGTARPVVVWDLFFGFMLWNRERKGRRKRVRQGPMLTYNPPPFILRLDSVWRRHAGSVIVVGVRGCKGVMPKKDGG